MLGLLSHQDNLLRKDALLWIEVRLDLLHFKLGFPDGDVTGNIPDVAT